MDLFEKFFSLFFQLPITHDDIFGEYSCQATNKMGTLTRQVKLSEGAKPGIPNLEIYKIDTESVQMTILVNVFFIYITKLMRFVRPDVCHTV